jgi:hypothetical protein
VEGGIITILRPCEPIDPGAGPVTGDAAEVHDNDLVHHLRLAVHLRMESSSHAERDAGQLEEVMPHIAGEHGVPIAHDRRGEPVQPNDAVEEGAGDRCRRIRVLEGNEMGVLGESLDDGEDDRLAAHLG